MIRQGFDNDKYITMQSEKIRERIDSFGGKLYMEFGGKLFDDHHASRVLPGFEPDSKLRMLLKLKEDAEIVIAISATSIGSGKRRRDLGISYDQEVLRLIDLFRGVGLYVGSVAITQYAGQKAADDFRERLQALGVKVFRLYRIEDYPDNVPFIVSDEGFGRNEYIETSRSLVVVTAPGPGSGKMATCLSQLYHEHARGISAGYAKFETFPVWNLPLNHPVNLAYEAATADLNDVNMIDPYHLEAYQQVTVNYNRDVAVFPLLNAIFRRIYGESPYKSPTDMGVNMVGNCICDDEAVCDAARQEIIRRYYAALCSQNRRGVPTNEVSKIRRLMDKEGIELESRPVVQRALDVASEMGSPAVALELPNGQIVAGRTKALLGPCAAVLLNALKALANIPNGVDLIASAVIEPVQTMKVKYLGNQNPRLHSDEVLVALSVSAATNPVAAHAMECLPMLAGCEAHASVIISPVDEAIFRKLKINLTCEPSYQSDRLYHE